MAAFTFLYSNQMIIIARPRQDFFVTVKSVFTEPLFGRTAKKFRRLADLPNLLICGPSANVEFADLQFATFL
jgi:hypothetical protein